MGGDLVGGAGGGGEVMITVVTCTVTCSAGTLALNAMSPPKSEVSWVEPPG